MVFLGKWGRWMVLGVASALLSACGPVIETHYDFQPPANQAGMQCVTGCQKGQNQCTRHEADARQECRYIEEARVDEAYREAKDRYDRDLLLYAASPEKFSKPTEPGKSYPSYHHCNDQGLQCQADFNMCYRACGGQVQERQVCVANCEE